jgi:hypothetical protein
MAPVGRRVGGVEHFSHHAAGTIGDSHQRRVQDQLPGGSGSSFIRPPAPHFCLALQGLWRKLSLAMWRRIHRLSGSI